MLPSPRAFGVLHLHWYGTLVVLIYAHQDLGSEVVQKWLRVWLLCTIESLQYVSLVSLQIETDFFGSRQGVGFTPRADCKFVLSSKMRSQQQLHLICQRPTKPLVAKFEEPWTTSCTVLEFV